MGRRRHVIEVLPSAKRLIGSLRDIGYETAEAVADLVDNSIAARAKNVDITISFDGAASWIRIADDGHGMSGHEITEAMKYGAERDYEDDDLGKFGLGLKTASMSQCRRLSVASRASKDVARIEARQLDLDLVEEHDSWSVVMLGAAERRPELVGPLRERRGTVVLWEDLDRILNYKNPGSQWARNRLLDLAEHLDQHLGMVFHRFLAGDVPRRKLRITINGTNVEPWDPFARSEQDTQELEDREFELHTSNGSGIVRLQPFILPRQDRFSSPAAHKRASGPNSWNRQQGFYVYRADRLIQSGGWSRLRTTDEHSKLARVALYFDPDLDAAFGINVAKMRVVLPSELKEQIRPFVDSVVRRAQAVYRAKPAPTQVGTHPGAGGNSGGTTGAHSGSNGVDSAGYRESAGWDPTSHAADGPGRSPHQGEQPSTSATVTTPAQRRSALERAADGAGEKKALRRIIKTLHDKNPEVAADLGW